MNINLHNYETFFLMYVDNELLATEREMVEAFVGKYPYLREELELLQDTVLQMEDDMTIDKTSLLKSAAVEEWMLLHLDNELTGDAKDKLLQHIQSNESLQKDWKLLQQTKLDSQEVCVFEDKAILYRKEKSKLIRFAYVRWAAAAALIAAGFFVGVNRLNKPKGAKVAVQPTLPKTTADNTNNNASATELVNTANGYKNNGGQTVPNENNTIIQATDITNQQKQLVSNKEAVPFKSNNKKSAISEVPTPQQMTYASSENNKNNLPDNKAIVRNTVGGNEPLLNTAGTQDLSINLIEKPEQRPGIKTAVINTSKEGNTMVMASLNTNRDDNNDHIFLMDEDDVNRSKAGVFFKRLKRTVARTAGVKPGNSLKIAGFEFAVK
jgi:hypothetical protein